LTASYSAVFTNTGNVKDDDVKNKLNNIPVKAMDGTSAVVNKVEPIIEVKNVVVVVTTTPTTPTPDTPTPTPDTPTPTTPTTKPPVTETVEAKVFTFEDALSLAITDPALADAFNADPRTPEQQEKVDAIMSFYTNEVLSFLFKQILFLAINFVYVFALFFKIQQNMKNVPGFIRIEGFKLAKAKAKRSAETFVSLKECFLSISK